MRLDICPSQPLHCLQSILSFGGQGLLACPGRPWPLVPRSISWVNERWDWRALISITMPTPASATLSPCHGLQHADITVSNTVSSECSQIRHNLGDKDWYRGHEVVFRYCCWKGQHWSFPTINFKGLTRTHALPKGEESLQQALSHKRSQSKGNSGKFRGEELEAIKQVWLTAGYSPFSCSLHIAAG